MWCRAELGANPRKYKCKYFMLTKLKIKLILTAMH